MTSPPRSRAWNVPSPRSGTAASGGTVGDGDADGDGDGDALGERAGVVEPATGGDTVVPFDTATQAKMAVASIVDSSAVITSARRRHPATRRARCDRTGCVVRIFPKDATTRRQHGRCE